MIITFSSSLHFSRPDAWAIHPFSDHHHLFLFLAYSFLLGLVLKYYFYHIYITNIGAVPFSYYLTITIKHKGNNLLVHGASHGSTKWLRVLGKLGHSKASQKSWLISLSSSGVLCSRKDLERSLKMKLLYPQAVKWKAVLFPGWRRCPIIKCLYASNA